MSIDVAGIGAVADLAGKVLERIFPNPADRIKAQSALDQLKASGELAKLTAETDLVKAFLADTESARTREATVVSSQFAPLLNKLITPLLAIGIVTLTFTLFGIVFYISDGTMSDSQERILLFVLGASVPICMQVVNYYFGSTRSDAAKDQHLRDMLSHKDQ